MRIASVFVLIVCFSCHSKSDRNYRVIQDGNLTIEGNVIKDSIFDDTIVYYNQDKDLLSKKVFKEGILEGESIDYFSSGKPRVISNFSGGKLNGAYGVYDSLGNITYSSFYYYDLGVGPVIFYKNRQPTKYFFLDLSNKDLFQIYYPLWDGINSIAESLITLSANEIPGDRTKEISVFLYLPRPPRFSFQYSILKVKDEDFDNSTFVKEISERQPFVSFKLPVLSSSEIRYVVKLAIHDSIKDKKTIIYRDIPIK